MVGNGGPSSPKRRKTANGPLTADGIAQTNSTAQIFAGQRMNRWMSGYESPAQEQPPTRPRQTENILRSASGTASMQRTQEGTMRAQQSANHSHGHMTASAVPAAPAAVSGSASHASSSSPIVEVAPFPLVDYESPPGNTTPHTRVNSASYPPPKTVDGIARTASTLSNRGLPSPVSSDGNINSPAMQFPFAFQTATPAPQAVPPRGCHRHSSGHQPTFRNGQPVPSTVHHHRGPSQPYHPQPMAPPTAPSNAGMNGHGSVHVQTHVPMYYPSSNLNPKVMLAKLNSFMDNVKSPNPIDHGRLLLLREAILKEDWFYIVLSQLHALSSKPAQLPTPAKHLPDVAFKNLSTLLSNNEALTPLVFHWLGYFPASILDLYSSPDNARYDSEVKKVARFLIQLSLQWEHLVAHCKGLEAPPLVEDLWDGFGLGSKVLQTTIFRTIARMIWSTTPNFGSNQGVEALERLHYYNQIAFHSGQRRVGEQLSAAYRAFKIALEAWRKFQTYQAQLGLNGRNPNGGPPDPRSVFVLPECVESVFQPAPSIPALGNIQRPQVGPNGASSVSPMPIPPAAPQRPPARQPPQTTLRTERPSPTQTGPMRSHSHPSPAIPYLFPVPVQRHLPHPWLIFPHESEILPRAQPTEPDTLRSALHQAHLRSPVLTSAQVEGATPRLYRYVASTSAIPPMRINENLPINAVSFTISDEALGKIPRAHFHRAVGGRRCHIINANTQTYRLRCVSMPAGGFPTEKAWVEADTFWPEKLYYDLNGTHLETRRKLHHGRYLPIDLTPYIQRGQNILKILVNRESTDKQPFNYAIAIETIGVKSHADIISNVTRLSATDSLTAIKTSLSSSTAPDADDDLAVTSSNTIINLFDPFYGDRMVRTPVRGTGCLHRDCFDLETFLATCKRETPDSPTRVDCWRCPICRGDIRPQTLVMDGFLEEVRRELEGMGLSGTRAVVVNADGSWVAREEERTGVRSASLERDEKGEKGVGVGFGARKDAEVVELD